MNTIKSVESKLNTLRKLRTGKKKADFKSLDELMTYQLTRGDDKMLPATYFPDKELQCEKVNIGRGFGDLYRLTRYYFPDISLRQMLLYFKKSEKYFIQFCCATERHVVRTGPYRPLHIPEGLVIDIDDEKFNVTWDNLKET